MPTRNLPGGTHHFWRTEFLSFLSLQTVLRSLLMFNLLRTLFLYNSLFWYHSYIFWNICVQIIRTFLNIQEPSWTFLDRLVPFLTFLNLLTLFNHSKNFLFITKLSPCSSFILPSKVGKLTVTGNSSYICVQNISKLDLKWNQKFSCGPKNGKNKKCCKLPEWREIWIKGFWGLFNTHLTHE